MQKIYMAGYATGLSALLSVTTLGAGAATHQEILRLAEAYPPGSVVVCRSDFPGDGKLRQPTTLINRGTVTAHRNNLTDYNVVLTWLTKGQTSNGLTLTFRATERTEKAGQYTRVDPDSMAVSLLGAAPEEEKAALAGFRKQMGGKENFVPYTQIEITDFPAYIIRIPGEVPVHCHRE